MACGSNAISPLNRNKGPGGAASSTFESIVKPADATGGRTRCIDCGDFECCCIPIPCVVM